MEIQNIACIDTATVDDVVISAMSMLIGDEPCESTTIAPGGKDCITVGVYCDGQQQSAVVLRCSQNLAMTLTGRMLELAPGEIADTDVVDATGELVNVIAGNLRGLVALPGAMTAPFLLDEAAYQSFHVGARNGYCMLGGQIQLLRV